MQNTLKITIFGIFVNETSLYSRHRLLSIDFQFKAMQMLLTSFFGYIWMTTSHSSATTNLFHILPKIGFPGFQLRPRIQGPRRWLLWLLASNPLHCDDGNLKKKLLHLYYKTDLTLSFTLKICLISRISLCLSLSWL